MKKNGFTIVEVLAVIVILGVLASIATVAVGRYRVEVTKKELINLKGLISDSYDTYRNDAYTDYEVPVDVVEFTNENGEYSEHVYSYFSDLSFDGKRLTLKNLYGSKFKLFSKGSLLSNDDYLADLASLGENEKEQKMIDDGTCVIEAKDLGLVEGGDGNSNDIHKFEKSCVMEKDKPKPALEEMLCIKLVVDGKVLIDDYSDENNLCKYFVGDNNE